MKDIYRHFISVVLIFMASMNHASAQIKKEYQVSDKNGFEWYLITDTKTGKQGATDRRGEMLIPTEYTTIYDDGEHSEWDDSVIGYFVAVDAQTKSAALYTQNGNCIIPKGKYAYFNLRYAYKTPYLFIEIGSNNLHGVADLYGKTIIEPKYDGIITLEKARSKFDKQVFYIEADTESNRDIYDLNGNLILSLNKEEVSYASLECVHKHPEKPCFTVWLENGKTAFYDIAGNHLLTVNKTYASLYQNDDGSFWYDPLHNDHDLSINFTSTDLTPFTPTKRFHESRIKGGYSSPNHSQAASVSNESSTNGKRQPNVTGTYTISQQGQSVTSGNYTGVAGPDMVVTIEFYDDGISVNGLWCEYAGESNGRKKYNDPMSFGGSSTAYYVDSNYNVQKQSTFSSPYGTDWFNYRVVKGNVSIPKNQPYNGGGYSNDGYSSPGSYSNGSSNSGSSNTYEASCPHCHGSGKCNTCNGTHRYLNPLTNKYITCPNCKPDGACSYCGGTGKKR